MNPLQNAKNGTLYNLDCTIFAKILFTTESPESAIFIFSADPTHALPEHVLLMPDGEEYDYSTFFYTLSPEVHIYNSKTTGEVCYFVYATTHELLASRNELRVDVSFDVAAIFAGEANEEIITVKNMSAGGCFFVSEKHYTPETAVSFIFSNAGTPVLVTAYIKRKRPTRFPNLYGYGCQFFGLPAKTEAAVRNYVFRNEVLQRKKAENDFQ